MVLQAQVNRPNKWVEPITYTDVYPIREGTRLSAGEGEFESRHIRQNYSGADRHEFVAVIEI